MGSTRLQYTKYTYFLINDCSNASDFFEQKIVFTLFLIAAIHSTANSKSFINEQIIIFYSPSNALCSSDNLIKIKHFNHHTFTVICSLSTWFNLQILNFCQLRHSESLTDQANVQMCIIIKIRCFYSLPIVKNQN